MVSGGMDNRCLGCEGGGDGGKLEFPPEESVPPLWSEGSSEMQSIKEDCESMTSF